MGKVIGKELVCLCKSLVTKMNTTILSAKHDDLLDEIIATERRAAAY